MSPQERDDILPQLAVFSSLFGYLLVTIHDTEFYSNQAQGKAWMPFSLTELVKMSLHLRDIALGLVELAFPDSRPAVREMCAISQPLVWACHGGLLPSQ